MQEHSRDDPRTIMAFHKKHHKTLRKYIGFVHWFDTIGFALIVIIFLISIDRFSLIVALAVLPALFILLYVVWKTMFKIFLRLLFRKNKEFSSLNFSKINLGYCNLSSKIFIGTDFSKANLIGANFQKSFLAESNLSNATMKEANFEGAYISNSLFLNTDLSNVIFQGALISGSLFFGANITKTQIPLAPAHLKVLTLTSLGFKLRTLVDLPPDIVHQIVIYYKKIQRFFDLPDFVVKYIQSDDIGSDKMQKLLNAYEFPVMGLATKYVRENGKLSPLEIERLKHEINAETLAYLERSLPEQDILFKDLIRNKSFPVTKGYQILM